MKTFLILIFVLLNSTAFGQASNPNETLKIGKGSTAVDKGFIFDTNEGASNKSLKVDGTSKALKFSGNDMQIGDGNTAANKKLTLDPSSGAGLRWNGTSQKVEKTDNGTDYKAVGAGAGGAAGQNLASEQDIDTNGDSSANGWNVVATATITTLATSSLNGENALEIDTDAQNDLVRTDQLTIPGWLKNQACEIKFLITGGSDDLVKPQAVDSGNTKLTGWTFRNQTDQTDFLKAHGSNVVQRSIFGLCPSSGTMALEFNQTAAGDSASFRIDDVHIGQNLGLVQTALPDEYSAKVNSSQTVTDVNVPSWISCSTVSTGRANCTFLAGLFSQAPSCTITSDKSGNDGCANADTLTASGLDVRIFTCSTGAAADNAFNIKCSKQGADAQQGVQVYTSIPKVSETTNTFKASISAAGSIIDQDPPGWLASVSKTPTGSYAFTPTAGVFTVIPNLMCSASLGSSGSGAREHMCTFFDVQSSPVSWDVFISKTVDQTGIDKQFEVQITKMGADVVRPTVQPILVKQVETSFKSGIRVETCKIVDSAGTPITASTLCDGWVASLTDNSTGDITVNFVSGTFSGIPQCISDAHGGDSCASPDVGSQLQTSNRYQTRACSTGATFDGTSTITCIGPR